MVFLDGGRALYALLTLLSVPAVWLLGTGIYYWVTGAQTLQPDRLRLGKMFTLLGAIFLSIVLITTWFLQKAFS
jgi:hypothetical protein